MRKLAPAQSLLVLAVVAGFAVACGMGAQRQSSAPTSIPATPTSSETQLKQQLEAQALSCDDLFVTDQFFTGDDGYEALVTADVEKGIIATHQRLCVREPRLSVLSELLPAWISMDISLLGTSAAAQDTVGPVTGDYDGTEYREGNAPLFGDRGVAILVRDREEGEHGAIVKVSVGRFAVIVFAMGVEESNVRNNAGTDAAYIYALDAAEKIVVKLESLSGSR